MTESHLYKNLNIALKQRTFFLALSIVTTLSILLLSAALSITITRLLILEDGKEKVTHILPGAPREEVILGKYDASDSYFKHLVSILLNLRLNNTPHTIEEHHRELMHYLSPSGQKAILEELSREESEYKKYNLYTQFSPTGFEVNRDDGFVRVTGIMDRFYGHQGQETSSKSYLIFYRYENGMITIEKFAEEEEA